MGGRLLVSLGLALVCLPIAAGTPARDEVVARLKAQGLSEGYDLATGRIVGIGCAFQKVVAGATLSDLDVGTYVGLVRTAKAKACLEISKCISSEMSADRRLEVRSCGNFGSRIVSRIIALRTSSHPLGRRVVAKTSALVGNEVEVCYAVVWSLEEEARAAKAYLTPERLDWQTLEAWAAGAEVGAAFGDGVWWDGKGNACFIGIGIAAIKGSRSVALKSSMTVAQQNAKHELLSSFLEAVGGTETLESSGRNSSYSHEISRRFSQMALPHVREVHTGFAKDFIHPGRTVCYSVYAWSPVESPEIVVAELDGKESDDARQTK